MSGRALRLWAMVAAVVALGSPPARAQLGDDALLDPSARLAAIDAEIAQALAQAESGAERKARVDAEIAGLSERRTAALRRLRSRARGLYRLTKQGLLPATGGLDTLLSHLSRVARLERMVKADVAFLRSLRERGTDLRRETSRLQGTIEQAQQRVGALEARKHTYEAQEQTALSFAAAFAQNTPAIIGAAEAPSYGTIRVVGDDDMDARGSSFASLRGSLALPLSEVLEMRDSHRAESDGQSLEFTTRAGASARAVAPGRVAFSDRYGSYGRLVILDHGDRYYTLYGGLDQAEVQIGDEVSQGARLGTTSGTTLVFEIRRGTRALPPREWLGI